MSNLLNKNPGSATALDIFHNHLNGSIPVEVGKMKSLEFLTSGSSNISSPIPTTLGDLTKLKVLHLYSNQLSGPAPSELGNLKNLTDLALSGNQLSGSIPTVGGDLTELKSLYLHSNQLVGPSPNELGNLKNLNDLALSHNQLSGSIPTFVDDLTELKNLYLHFNQLAGPVPSDLTELKSLYLHSNQLSGLIPSELGNLEKLTDLALSDNQLSGLIPIVDVVLSYHELEGPILDNKAFTNASLEGNKGLCGNLTGFQPCERPSSHLIGKRRKLILIILLPVMGVLVLLCAFLGVLFMCDKRRRAKDVERWNDDSWLSISMLYGKALYRDILNPTEEFDATF
ncbi:MDIS1-interacting receptor like kinase 2-like [Capsicum annuum]